MKRRILSYKKVNRIFLLATVFTQVPTPIAA